MQDPFGIQTVANKLGDSASFIWYIDVYTIEGAYLFSTPDQESPTTSYTMGAEKIAALDNNVTYVYQVVMQSRSRIPGYPTYVIKSAKKEFTVEKTISLVNPE